MNPTRAKKIHEGLYELCGYSIRSCSDDYQRAWAVEQNGNLIRGFPTLKESKAWILDQTQTMNTDTPEAAALAALNKAADIIYNIEGDKWQEAYEAIEAVIDKLGPVRK